MGIKGKLIGREKRTKFMSYPREPIAWVFFIKKQLNKTNDMEK